MRYKLVISVLFLVWRTIWGSSARGSHPITTFIDAKWNVTPVSLEISEFLAEENPRLYWAFIDELNSLGTPVAELESEAKQYQTVMKIARGFLVDAQVELLKLSLSLRSLSPLVQAHQQIALDTLTVGPAKCGKAEAFVVLGEKVLCSGKEVKAAILNADANDLATSNTEIFNFDQIYPGSEQNPVTVILYSEIGTKASRKYHSLLKEHSNLGTVKYINRHYVRDQINQRVRLSGYGVELHMKSTEYKSQDDSPRQPDEDLPVAQESTETEVNGFDFKVLKQRHPNLETFLDRYRSQMLERTEELAPLKAWQFQELSLQAAQQIAAIQGDDSLHIMQHLAQNFPTQAKTLLSVRVNNDFKDEMRHNIEIFGRSLNLQPPDAALFVNGLYFDVESLDTETLLDALRTEQRSMAALHNIGVPGTITRPLLTLDLGTASKEFALDIRDSAILWINDIETDAQYKRWPNSVLELLRPTFPGMLRSIRKNLFNLVLIVDPVQANGRQLIKLAESFVLHLAPVRLGLVMDFRQETAETKEVYDAILFAFNYMFQTKSPKDALGFLTDIYSTTKDDSPVMISQIRATLKKAVSGITSDQLDDILGTDSDYDYGRQLATEFVGRLGSTAENAVPMALMNGVPISESLITSDDFEEGVLTEIVQQTPVLQKAVYKGELTDSDNVLDYIMGQPHVMPRLHPTILNANDAKYLDLTGKEAKDLNNVKLLAALSDADMSATLIPNLGYFYSKNSFDKLGASNVHFITVWVVADLQTDTGVRLLENALEFAKSTRGVRVAFLPNSESQSPAPADNLNNFVWAASQLHPGHEALDAITQALNGKKEELKKLVKSGLSSTPLHVKMIRVYCQRVLKFGNQRQGIVLNGRVLGPLAANEVFSVNDFSLMDRFATFQYGDKIKKVLRDAVIDEDITISSDTILKLISVLVPRQNTKSRFNIPSDLKEEHTVLQLQAKRKDQPRFEIVAVLDPASKGAQKLAPLLILLRNVLNCEMRVFMCAIDKHSDLPVKNFYRFVIEPELQFSKEGKLQKGPIAKFTGLPSTSLLTQTLQIPDNWLVEVVNSVYDLDNIRLSDIQGPVHSNYELEFLLLEGHCFDATSGSPPRGLQFTLGTRIEPIVVDTIVMANLGYFQLKANPGAWLLKLRHGKSSDIYDVSSVEGKNVIQRGDESRVVISSLKSNVIKVKVTRKPGQLTADLLSDDSDGQGTNSGIWDSIKSSFPGGGGSDDGSGEDQEVINIFSVASGHLYERLLRIMMLSTLKNTKTPVKFWFLKNYLSPQFVDFLPHMAKEYKFQYELVQYKWPRWLHQQTEKQRIIWGYKILFLDVLFPLGVKKIIFVDADAIVRGDLKELNNLDLGGAPYAYTPFCDSRKEMEGFRFWKQGYWRTHLQGRKYHISALYVVDLKRFRKIAAGDRLRGQYQALSQDPNSLSNLDQDLPNNMIHQVSIKSLPQEWLYCETWCSRDGFSNAKVIDLCNNPQTKEAKLTAAQRIVPEWTEYDSEIKRLLVRVDSEMHEHVVRQPQPSQTSAEDQSEKQNRDEL